MIPNYLEAVKAARTTYADAWAHAHIEGDPRRHEFIKLLAADLYKQDPRVALNGKRGNPSDLSMDALNILCEKGESDGRTPEGLPCVVVDVIGGAGGPNPVPTWSVFTNQAQGSGARVIPGATPTSTPQPVPPPSKILPKGEAFAALTALNRFYAAPEGLQRKGGLIREDNGEVDTEGVAQWFYQIVIEGVPLDAVFTQIRNSQEWKDKHR